MPPESRYAAAGTLSVKDSPRLVPFTGSVTLVVDRVAGRVDGSIRIDEMRAERAVAGRRIATARTTITQVGPLRGIVHPDDSIEADVSVEAAITSVRLGGLPLLTGPAYTVESCLLPLRSEQGFDLARGGVLSCTYTRPRFGGGGPVTRLLNLVLAGPGNRLTIRLTRAGA